MWDREPGRREVWYRQWSLTAKAPPAPADVTITATTQFLTTLIFAGSDLGIDITGEPGQSNDSGS